MSYYCVDCGCPSRHRLRTWWENKKLSWRSAYRRRLHEIQEHSGLPCDCPTEDAITVMLRMNRMFLDQLFRMSPPEITPLLRAEDQ